MEGQPVLQYFISEQGKALGGTLRAPRPLDAGYDVCCVTEVSIPPSGFSLIETGVYLAIPEGWVGLVRDRSSIALRGGAVTAGVIDASYRGEVKVAMHNLGTEVLHFDAGHKIAQLVVVPHLTGSQSVESISQASLGQTKRGDGGFGSTGK